MLSLPLEAEAEAEAKPLVVVLPEHLADLVRSVVCLLLVAAQ